MLKIAYIATTEPIEKPKKLSKKELLHQEATETLAVRRHQDQQKAEMMFPELKEEIRLLEIKLAEQLKRNNTNYYV